MTSTRKEHNVDARAKGAVSFFVACSSNPTRTLKISAAMRAKGYSDTKAVNRALQKQVRWGVKKLIRASATLSAVAAMVTLSLTVTTRALAMILPEDANSTWPLDIPLPPRKTHKTSQQCQIDCQNGRKSNVVYDQALAQATMLVATKRTQAKENCRRQTSSVIVQGLCGVAQLRDSQLLHQK
jgi:hypothetical protein